MLTEKSFYFARHGESEHNARGICAGGKSDSPLSAKGIVQAHCLKNKLFALGIDYVISSPMIRAKMTAEIAGGRPLLIDENLREIDLGECAVQRRVDAEAAMHCQGRPSSSGEAVMQFD